MQYLLSRASRSILKRLARKPILCAFDFDGTLSPIVERPDRARMRVQTRKLLRRLTAVYPCVIVSGRARADVLGKLGGVKVARVIGNHGAETESTARKRRNRRVAQWNAALKLGLDNFPGVWVEDKGLSLAVHYRQSPQKAEARRRIFALARTLEQARVFGGKQVVNVVMDKAPHKGEALAAERNRLGCSGVLYVGDDENDEDAFSLDGNIVPVRIGRKRRSHARYYLRTQAEIDQLLELLLLDAAARKI
ncbi:MAG: trehalose-phosphatase [Acidobacteriia bacterium]|nr:trehalose-phosphatase [Terriglobia bacterium]